MMAQTSLQRFMKNASLSTSAAKPPRKKPIETKETMTAFFVLNPTPINTPSISNDDTPAVVTSVVRKDVRDKDILVARYGKIYKRKAASPFSTLKLKCAPGLRYCKICDSHKPLADFYTLVKRFVCRKCHYERVYSRLKMKKKTHEKIDQHFLALYSWTVASIHRIWFGYAKLEFDCNTIEDIIVNSDIPWHIRPTPCPIDPSLPMRPRNVAILSSRAFQLLINVWEHTCSRGNYIAFVQRCNLVPRNFDVAFPCTPYQDVDYMRPIIDVAPILINEQEDPISISETVDHLDT